MAIQGEGKTFELIRCEDSEAWLRERKNGIGGSDVAAIMGLSPWKTPMELWLEKTGRVDAPDISDKPYVQFGNIMEPVVGEWYSEKHPDHIVRRVNAICQSVERPWAQASLDYEVRDPERDGWGILEIKTARSSKDWESGVPAYYLTQVTHYMSVTGRSYAYVAVFFRDSCEFASFNIERDEDDIKAVNNAVDEFWNTYVRGNSMPQLAGTSGEISAMAQLYSDSDGEIVTLTDGISEADEAIAAYQDASQREKQAKEDKTKAAATLAKLAGEHKGFVTDVARVTWVRSQASRFDSKALQADMPEVYERYAKEYTRNGGIRIKEIN